MVERRLSNTIPKNPYLHSQYQKQTEKLCNVLHLLVKRNLLVFYLTLYRPALSLAWNLDTKQPISEADTKALQIIVYFTKYTAKTIVCRPNGLYASHDTLLAIARAPQFKAALIVEKLNSRSVGFGR